MIKFVYKLLFILLITTVCTDNILLGQQELTKEQAEEKITIPNQVIVRMHEGRDPNVILQSVPSEFKLSINRILSVPTDIWLLEFDDTKVTVKEILKYINKVEDVWQAQPNREVQLRAAPNDPNYGNQWQHNNIDSELAWDITTGGTTATGDDIVVCVIESADVMGHPDLQNNHWVNTAETPNNGIDDDNNGYVDDYNGWNVGLNNDNLGTGGHGTAVAGMIGAQGNNSQGVAGANWDVKIMIVAGYANPFTEANIVEAYTYSLESRILWNQTNGAQGSFVVSTNASWGIDGGDPNDYPIWCSFYDDMGQAGILNCGATTNQNQDVDTFGDVPTGCASPYMVGVTATDINDQITFAGYGDQTINVAAPGDNIYSTASNGGYSYTSGTSFASPLTAGVIGLLYSVPCPNLTTMAQSNPQGTADIVRDALYSGVDQSAHLQARTISGGRINARNSIDLLMAQVCGSCLPPTSISTTQVNDNDASISFDPFNSADDHVIYIQESGSGTWNNFTTSDSSFTFTGLTTCTTYEYYIQSNCGTETSLSSTVQTFTTSGCGNCIELNYCLNYTNDNPGTTFTVHEPAGVAGSYNFETTDGWGVDPSNGYVYGEVVLVDDGTINPEEGCDPLINAAAISGNIAIAMRGSCNFTQKALNAQNAGATAIIIVNNNGAPFAMGGTDPGINIPAIMIGQTEGTNLINELNNGSTLKALIGNQNEWIESFELNNITETSGDDGGYKAPDLTPFQMNRSQAYSFTMTPGFDGQPLPQYTRIWIDLDQSGDFSASEMLYDQGGVGTNPVTGTILIPNTAIQGNTRMRVQMAYQGFGSGNLPSTCGGFTSGEVEDYCVEIGKDVADLSEVDNQLDISVYPNPAKDNVNFKTSSSLPSTITVYDPTGKKISVEKIENKTATVKVNRYTSGLYIYHVKDSYGNILYINKLSVVK